MKTRIDAAPAVKGFMWTTVDIGENTEGKIIYLSFFLFPLKHAKIIRTFGYLVSFKMRIIMRTTKALRDGHRLSELSSVEMEMELAQKRFLTKPQSPLVCAISAKKKKHLSDIRRDVWKKQWRKEMGFARIWK